MGHITKVPMGPFTKGMELRKKRKFFSAGPFAKQMDIEKSERIFRGSIQKIINHIYFIKSKRSSTQHCVGSRVDVGNQK
jgi:hypothetical protein